MSSRTMLFLGLTLLLAIVNRNNLSAQPPALVSCTITSPDTVRAGDTVAVTLTLAIETGWHVYAPESVNEQQGMTPVRLQFLALPPGLNSVGAMTYTHGIRDGTFLVLSGKESSLTQRFTVSETIGEGAITLQGNLIYQACDDEICYPPSKEPFSKTITVAGSGDQQREADAAWKTVERSAALFADKSEQDAYKVMKPLDSRRFEDGKYNKKASAAYDFWKRFPDDYRRGKALAIFLSADPWFVAAAGNEGLDKFETWMDIREANVSIGSMAIDTAARNVWLELGDVLVAEVLGSNDSATVKERAAFAQFARDYRLAAKHFVAQDTVQDEAGYWQPHYERFRAHAEAYADLSNIGARAEDFLSALKGQSPLVAADYWHRLQVVPALRETAGNYLQVLALESGKRPVQMKFTAMDGTPFDLEALRGKVVLLDFWATWCKPCLAELPDVKAMYDKYRDQGFEVVGFCLDDESARARASEILSSHGASWPQRFEGVGFNDDAYRQLYGINALPTVWLLDKEGKVIDRNARGERMEGLIRQQLGI